MFTVFSHVCVVCDVVAGIVFADFTGHAAVSVEFARWWLFVFYLRTFKDC